MLLAGTGSCSVAKERSTPTPSANTSTTADAKPAKAREVDPPQSGPPKFPDGERTGSWACRLRAVAGSVAVSPVELDSNGWIRVLAICEGQDSEFAIVTESGVPLTPVDEQSDRISSTCLMRSCLLKDPPIGRAFVRLKAGPKSDADVVATLSFDNGRALIASVTPPREIAPSDTIVISAAIRDADGSTLGGSSRSCEGTLSRSTSETKKIRFFDDGQHDDGRADDGVFGARIEASALQPDVPYDLLLRAECVHDHEGVQRSTDWQFEVHTPDRATIVDPSLTTPDANGDGLIDALAFEFEVRLHARAAYRLSAELYDSRHVSIYTATTEATYDTLATPKSLKLVVPAKLLQEHGLDGPWTLGDIALVPALASTPRLASAPDFITPAIALSKLAPLDPPRVDKVVPWHGPLEGGNEISITGAGLRSVATLRFGELDASWTVQSDSSLLVRVPKRPSGSNARTVDVVLISRWGEARARNAYSYVD